MDLVMVRNSDGERKEKKKGGRELGGKGGSRWGERDGNIITSEVKPLDVSESLPTSRNL